MIISHLGLVCLFGIVCRLIPPQPASQPASREPSRNHVSSAVFRPARALVCLVVSQSALLCQGLEFIYNVKVINFLFYAALSAAPMLESEDHWLAARKLGTVKN